MDRDLLAGLRALVDLGRLRIVARLAERPIDIEALAAELRLPAPGLARQLETLVRAGIVERRDPVPTPDASERTTSQTRYAVRADRLAELARALAAAERDQAGSASDAPEGDWPHEGESLAATLQRIEASPEEARTLRSFLADGRLATIPAQHRKRQVVLRFLLERVFTEDREYPEKEVNQRLALFHPDVAALRRYLVDDGYVTRQSGLYRRASAPPA